MLYIKLKEMEHKIPCLPVCGEFCGLLMIIFPISLNPGQNFVIFFFYIFLTWSQGFPFKKFSGVIVTPR